MQFVDRAFARRLEAAEDVAQVHYTELYRQLHPEIGAAAEEICGGHMAFAGVGSPMGRAIGLGFDGPISLADLVRLESFYQSHYAPVQIDVTPLHDPALWELLKTRGYKLTELNNVLFRSLSRYETFPGSAQSRLTRPAHPEEAAELGVILERSFFAEGGAPEGMLEILIPLFQMESAQPFVTECEDRLAACGAVMAIKEFDVCALYGAGTLPEFRERGFQTALLHARLKIASESGCAFAVAVTRGGTASQRNCERLGFHVAYSKATLVKEL